MLTPQLPKQKLLNLKLALALVVLIAGCTSPPATLAPLPTLTATPAPATATPLPQLQDTATLLPTATSFVPRAVIKIASHSSLSGNQGAFGTDMMRGAQLAVYQMADPLAELGYQVELVPYNDENNLEVATANTIETIADRDVLCSIGHLSARITAPMSELYHQAGLALIAPSTSSPNLTDRRYREVNRLIGRLDRQGIAAALFADDQGFENVYIVSERDSYGLKNAEYFRLQADSSGIQVLGMVILGRNDTVEAIVPRVLVSNPDLIYFAGKAEQAFLFFREVRAAGFTGALLGLDDLNSPQLIQRAGPSLPDGRGLYFTVLTAPANFYPGADDFINRFEVQYGNSPLLFAARAYDAAGICMQAIENASNARGGEIPTRAEVVAAIRALKDYQGVTGSYTFTDQGDRTFMEYYIFQVVSTDLTNWDENSIVAAYNVTAP